MSKFTNPYVKTQWFDQIEDPTLPDGHPDKILEEGTVFTAEAANNIEDGIYNSYERIIQVERENQRIRVQLDLKERANSELVFYDTLDGEPARKMELDTARTVVKEALTVGATALNVVDASSFKPLTEVTLYDGTNSEDVLITAINGDVLTVQPITKNYSKGAFVARTNAELDTLQQRLKPGRWGTYTISLSEVV
ncbi:hypothetical protein [Cytobacillus firmus]|uniref:hypothetical protein n=1 Tax=Cytobacillus firmus TaxID=1399 RepID=UPI0018CF1474|nr:hypothetical protein [Cytobacillus firmus]MBG9548359.1 hypothetical protein [Cytobacillus firmus]MBG9600791.1 hypothetical protein [Cytobacillus firmus]MED1938954.1 hypothetical protein [Cytobacillus firmus]